MSGDLSNEPSTDSFISFMKQLFFVHLVYLSTRLSLSLCNVEVIFTPISKNMSIIFCNNVNQINLLVKLNQIMGYKPSHIFPLTSSLLYPELEFSSYIHYLSIYLFITVYFFLLLMHYLSIYLSIYYLFFFCFLLLFLFIMYIWVCVRVWV